MSSRITDIKNNVSPEDLASTDCMLGKTWRIFYISQLQNNYKEESFVQNIITSIRDHFQRHIMLLDNMQLQLVLLHEIFDIEGFDYRMGFYLRFQNEYNSIELRCCILANIEDKSKHSFILVKGRKDTRKIFLSWLEQCYDVFIDTSTRRFSPYQFNQFCDSIYINNSGSNSTVNDADGSNDMLCVFSLPNTIDGIRRITTKMSIDDISRVLAIKEDSIHIIDIIKQQCEHVLSIDPDLLILEEIASNNIVFTRDGRIKFQRKVCINAILHLLSLLSFICLKHDD